MDGVRSIESLAAGDAPHHSFRTLGPTLLISMGYLDLGKWVVALEVGSRFGYDLVLLVLLFNLAAILCQYLSSCIGIVTGKNLAEICHQEYSKTICVVLGLEAGLSLLTSEIAMIAGIAVGSNHVFEFDDLTTIICFAGVAINLLPYTLSRLGKSMAGIFNACIAGFALLLFVVGLLVSHPETPLYINMNVIFPKLSGESAYSLMALLGTNIIVHNFYTHSKVVQVQRNHPVLTLGDLFHDHLFSILSAFSGIFLVNYVLLSLGADESKISTTFKEAIELMDQIFKNPAAPILLLVILLFSGHIISLTCIIGSGVISEHLFGAKLPLLAHHVITKGFAVITTIYCAKAAGPEGVNQLLIMCPVIQAMLLPSSVIPIFRVSSSRLLMGRHRVSRRVEILSFLAFLLTLITNIIFAAEIMFGDSTWTNNLRGNTGSPVVVPYTLVVLCSCASIASALLLAVTTLKSACNGAGRRSSESEAFDNTHEREVQMSYVDAVPPSGSLKGKRKTAVERTDLIMMLLQ